MATLPKHPVPVPVAPAWPALMPAPAVAIYLGINVRSVWRNAATGEIPRPVKLGGKTLWKRSQLDELIEKLKSE